MKNKLSLIGSLGIAAVALLIVTSPAKSDQLLYQDVYPPGYSPLGPLSNGAGNQITVDDNVADSFTLGAADYVNSFEFIGLSDPGSTLQSVQYYLSDSYFSSPIAGPAQTVSLVAGTDLGDYTIGGTSYDLKDYTLSTGSDLLSAGTYYLNLTDGVSSDSGYAAVFDQLYGTSDAYREYVNGASISGPYTAGSDTLSAYGNPAPEMSTFSSMLLSAGSLAALVGLSLRRRKSLI